MNREPFIPDPQAGTTWFSSTEQVERLPLVAALVTRFNHDLRTPLNTISGWTHMLREGASDPVRARHVSEVFARSIRDGTALLEEFVDDVRVLVDVLVLNPVNVAAEDLLAEATDRLVPLLDVHDVELQRTDAVDGVVLRVDRTRGARLLYRLLLTAVRRAPAGASVERHGGRDRGRFAIEIDAPSSKTTFDDLSLLELRLASIVTAQLGGTLEIARPGTGSRFRLQLPTSE